MFTADRLLSFMGSPPDQSTVPVALDYCEEEGVDTAALLRLFAGEPPEWRRESVGADLWLHRLLVGWLQRAEPAKAIVWPLDGITGLAPSMMARFRVVAEQAMDWRRVCYETEVGYGSHPANIGVTFRQVVETALGTHLRERVQSALGRAIRDWKRRVLGLFPDVTRTVQCYVSQRAYPVPAILSRELRPFFEHKSFILGHNPLLRILRTEDRENRRWVYTQTLAAPDWIAPEQPWEPFEDGLDGSSPFVFSRDDPLLVETTEALRTGDFVALDGSRQVDGGWPVRRTEDEAEAIGQALESAEAGGRVRVHVWRQATRQ